MLISDGVVGIGKLGTCTRMLRGKLRGVLLFPRVFL
jgi:hypothetical protein